MKFEGKLKNKDVSVELEDKDALLIMAIQDLTEELKRARMTNGG